MRRQAFLILCVYFPLNSFAADFECPQKLSTSQVVREMPSNWNVVSGNLAMSPTELQLRNVHFYVGTKENHSIELSPEKENLGGIEVWKFGKRVKGEAIFQVCEYEGTVVEIERILPEGIHSCSVEHPKFEKQIRENNFELFVKRIECK